MTAEFNISHPPLIKSSDFGTSLKLVSDERARELDIPQLLALWHGGDMNRMRALEIADRHAATHNGDRN